MRGGIPRKQRAGGSGAASGIRDKNAERSRRERFTDRDGFSTTVELRHRLLSVDAMTTHVDVEVMPFVDAGRVLADLGTFPFEHLHTVGGLGFRTALRGGLCGRCLGQRGIAVFTGVGYPS